MPCAKAATKSKKLENTIADLEIQLERISTHAMTTMNVMFVVDQGGGSFTAFLFGPGAKQLQKFKSYEHADLVDHAVLSKLHAQTGVTLLAKDGTFNDYSAVRPRFFPLVTEALAAFYRAALGHMCVAQSIRVADVTTFKVRQTGKIRARLCQKTADAVAARTGWEKSFRASLKHWHAVGSWDYALLDNAHEAEMEAGSFFSLSASAKNYMVGLGVGSSSTQGYARKADGHLCFAFDTCLGAKPTAAEKRDGKSWTVFQKQFHQLLAKLFRHKSQTTVVALNAIGYAVLGMTHSKNKWDGQPAFASRVKDGKTFSPAELLHATEQFYAVCPDGHWDANLLRGFAAACSQTALDSALSKVLLERKKANGKALPFEVSWIKYLVRRDQVVRTVISRMHSNGSTL